ncbi:winged helix-turn-helix transcriptional regulator [Albimonas pacifica]|uniref:Transcriptional regulator, HxlR family n=1 Tax=Albimonas pacifica TaxID=1114924 RepID=A0A1I3PCG4_9RHOB|nr:helix-turn-helix domain-containing protein [Albimonas pacifica]SFJ19205.1 transcriptional regulator, HxlR family [Albimonas pacifica]
MDSDDPTPDPTRDPMTGPSPGAARDRPACADPAQAAERWTPVVFDVYRRDCASHVLLKGLANRWVVLVVSALAMGTLRHSELARKVEGATPKMLTQTLRELERDGLVTRRVSPASPPRVDYALTPAGRDLAVILRRFCRWSETHAAGILLARARAAGEPLSETTWRRLAGLERG